MKFISKDNMKIVKIANSAEYQMGRTIPKFAIFWNFNEQFQNLLFFGILTKKI